MHVGQLDGRVAVITGSTTGIGFAIAKALFGEGASVVLNGRNEETGAKARQELGDPDRSVFVAADVRSREGVDSLVAAAVEQFGTLDIMVNNAGGLNATAPVVDMTDEVWDDAIKWNLYATFWGTRAALKVLIPKRSGRIINISSVAASYPTVGQTNYAGPKAAVEALTRCLAVEFHKRGVTVNCVSPGLIDTEMGNQGDVPFVLSHQLVKRLGKPEEIAAWILMLASRYGDYVSGRVFELDGGFMMV